jgi:hypothetical protein
MRRLIGRSRLALVSGLVVLSLTALPGVVLAAPSTTPNGFCGALNMVQAWGVGEKGGMAWAMYVDTLHGNGYLGNDGMATAVGASDCR